MPASSASAYPTGHVTKTAADAAVSWAERSCAQTGTAASTRRVEYDSEATSIPSPMDVIGLSPAVAEPTTPAVTAPQTRTGSTAHAPTRPVQPGARPWHGASAPPRAPSRASSPDPGL